ncbi:hypothetical protein [Pseudoalteromonas tunicata]|uniref:Uncharacterized protein n=1 Tax=Pseudoalteromonas tunicata D2 TaxID=87626 RepID=A4CB79_9GAMM|nr:hypothetical protein [Pseudoalteromonas tunicata]ATC94176.1 hypothetical protein PTUN_a1563 [Pseudoalteromonas tunicata]AXT29938.1 hypothetical protein D1819_03400 [Pseudoalteromonas tunicata]EAR27616.1 hypothetical protein PTD2_17380 [Pseudoalteromonas tunicata D2]
MNNRKLVVMMLKKWGRYQARQELGNGYASKSPTEKIREFCELGVHGSSFAAEERNVPEYLELIDGRIAQLPQNYMTAIRVRFVLQVERGALCSFGFSSVTAFEICLERAINALLG